LESRAFPLRIGLLASHPVQYQAPWFRALAKPADLQVFFAHRPDRVQQGEGFGRSFEWDLDLLSGYQHQFLRNVSRRPSVTRFTGCDTPDVAEIIHEGEYRPCSEERDGPMWKRFDAFIVSGWHLKCYWQAVRACRRSGIPVLVRGDSQLGTPRSLFKRLAKAILYRGLLRQFDGFLCVGQRNREYLLKYHVPTERLFSARHFVDNEWFAKRAEEARPHRVEMRRRWGAENQTLVVLFVGKLIQKKRPGDLLGALARPELKGIKARAVFVGSGELDGELRATARTCNVAAVFEGFRNQTELPSFYASADVLVLPSDGGETWGLVVNEAMACGLPAIVSDAVGCAPDLIEEGRTGFTFPLGDVGALAQRLGQISALSESYPHLVWNLNSRLKSYSIDAAVRDTLDAILSLTNSTYSFKNAPAG
jgi:glycosyltransferase involved in cell wall biosynthesis